MGPSNLCKPVHRLNSDAGLDAGGLLPSSSLPNLVTLPNTTTPAPVLNDIVPPRHEQTQLNNQVPPGNRANNYWDNFRR